MHCKLHDILLRSTSTSLLDMQMDIRYDAFIRTTEAKHEGVVRAILDRVWDAGDIYKAKYEGAACSCFLDRAQQCPMCSIRACKAVS